MAEVDLVLAALADPTRRAIVEMLAVGPLRAGAVHAAFPAAAPAISRHLRILRAAGVIVQRRVASDARVRVYELAPAAIAQLIAWLQAVAGAGLTRLGQAQLDAFGNYATTRAALGARDHAAAGSAGVSR